MRANATPLFTAAQIARAIGRTRQAAQRLLAPVPQSGAVIVKGIEAAAWTVAALPENLRVQLAEIASRGGWRNVDALLAIPQEAWQPALPVAEIDERHFTKARKVRDALQPSLECLDTWSGTQTEFNKSGVERFKLVVGAEISTVHFQRLIERTLERDRGLGDFGRLDLYLDERLTRKGSQQPNARGDANYRALCNLITEFDDPGNPTAEDKQYLWIHLFQTHEQEIASGRKPNKSKRALLKFIDDHASFLAASTNARRVAWNRNYSDWIDGGRKMTALDDARATNSGWRRTPELGDVDRKLLTAFAAKCGGGIDMAWRELVNREQLSPNIVAHYAGSMHCPRAIRDQIKHDVELAKDSLHGPNRVKSNGAFVDRDPNGIASGDRDQSDDMTMVNVWWEDTPGGLWCGQGQLLVWIDERSWFVYSYALLSDPYYTGFDIRNSWTVKALDWGLPRKGFTLERGIWKRSRILVGRPDEVDPLVTERGLMRLGLDFQHPTHARGKIIESVYRLTQNYFQMQRGYIGRNPLTDRYEEAEKQKALVKTGKSHPSEFFLSKAQWREVLDEVFLHYNNTPLHGKYHEGLTPKECYEKHFTDKLMAVTEEHSYLVASNQIVTRIGGNGITFRFGNKRFNYKNVRTGELRGQHVIAWFNALRPEMLRCTDMKGENPFVVALSTSPYNHDPIPGTLEKALTENAEHNRYQRELHKSLKPYYKGDFFSTLFRQTTTDQQARELVSEFERQEQAITVETRERTGRNRTVQNLARKHNMAFTPAAARNAESVKSAKRLAELLAEAREEKKDS